MALSLRRRSGAALPFDTGGGRDRAVSCVFVRVRCPFGFSHESSTGALATRQQLVMNHRSLVVAPAHNRAKQ